MSVSLGGLAERHDGDTLASLNDPMLVAGPYQMCYSGTSRHNKQTVKHAV